MQTLDLNAEPRQGRKPREIGLPWSLLLIPIFFVAAGLSLPYVLVAGRFQQRRERSFRVHMQARGRVMEWSDFLRAVEDNRGTLIEERYSFKGPDRWWWTSENVYEVCPHAMVDWMTMLNDARFHQFAKWCRQRYTSSDDGRALLVATHGAPSEEVRSLRSRLESESGTVRWIEVAPPESLRRK